MNVFCNWLAKCSLTQIIHVQIRFYITEAILFFYGSIIIGEPWQNKHYCLYPSKFDLDSGWKDKERFRYSIMTLAVRNCKLNCLALFGKRVYDVCVCVWVALDFQHKFDFYATLSSWRLGSENFNVKQPLVQWFSIQFSLFFSLLHLSMA